MVVPVLLIYIGWKIGATYNSCTKEFSHFIQGLHPSFILCSIQAIKIFCRMMIYDCKKRNLSFVHLWSCRMHEVVLLTFSDVILLFFLNHKTLQKFPSQFFKFLVLLTLVWNLQFCPDKWIESREWCLISIFRWSLLMEPSLMGVQVSSPVMVH